MVEVVFALLVRQSAITLEFFSYGNHLLQALLGF